MTRSRAALLAALALGPAGAARAQDPLATGSNFGGVGLIESRNARFRPDGTLEAGLAWRHQRQFYFLNFQALPFVEATFRLTDRLNGTTGRDTTNDRSFDLKFRLWEEGQWRPALAVGFQDLIGTGLYAGEYVVASKRVGDFDFSLGMGWGRLGTGADLRNPFGLASARFDVRPRSVGEGGRPSLTSYFRGRDVALFGGVEWRIPPIPTPFGDLTDLRGKLEFSGDALRDERGGYPARTTNLRGEARSRVNLGLEWQPAAFVDAGIYFTHGTDLVARVSLRFDPAQPPVLWRPPAPAFQPRPAAEAAPDPAPAAGADSPLDAALRRAGFRPIGIHIAGGDARIAVEGGRHATLAQVAGRVLRAAQPHLPPAVERIEIAWYRAGLQIARVQVLREAMEGAVTGRGSAEEVLSAAALLVPSEENFPAGTRAPGLAWAIEPRIAVQFGDPKSGLLWQGGVGAGARIGLGEGFAVAGSVAQSLVGNLSRGRASNSVLPRVRSDAARYAREGQTSIPTLYAERLWSPAPDWFARVTAGLLEPMFAGVSGELLWRPPGRPIALGLDLAWVAQRDYRQRLSTLGYSVATGHLSAYADLPMWNLYTIIRGGRYLAGDWGGTLEVGRRFDSGIEVGGFATLTNVPFRRFGEGSFDKGIYVRIPLEVLGPETPARATALIRPVARDGGQRLAVDNPLWPLTRDGRADALVRGYTGFLR